MGWDHLERTPSLLSASGTTHSPWHSYPHCAPRHTGSCLILNQLMGPSSSVLSVNVFAGSHHATVFHTLYTRGPWTGNTRDWTGNLLHSKHELYHSVCFWAQARPTQNASLSNFWKLIKELVILLFVYLFCHMLFVPVVQEFLVQLTSNNEANLILMRAVHARKNKPRMFRRDARQQCSVGFLVRKLA